MIFAVYKSQDKKDKGPGRFTPGRLYLAESDVDEQTVVNLSRLQVTDDQGQKISVEPENDRFEYPEEVYAVVVKAYGERFPGEVVTITEGQSGSEGEFLNEKHTGYIRAHCFQLMDATMVKPGMVVYDKGSSRWRQVMRVDECMRIMVEGQDAMRGPEDFIFAVSDGELATVPLLRCVDDSGMGGIKEGELYRVNGLDDDGHLLVVDDRGKERALSSDRFQFA